MFVLCITLLLAPRPAVCRQAQGNPLVDGKALFLEKCSKCHGETGEGISGVISIAGPSLRAEHDYGHVLTAIEYGPSHMPSFSYILTVPEMRALADYVTQQIAVIPLEKGDLSEGGELFRTHCSGCHRTAVRGGVLAFTGVNAPALTGKSRALIAGTVRWGPGPMPAFPASVISDRQLASIVDYVKYVQHPPHPGGDTLRWIGPVAEGFMGALGVLLLIAVAVWIERGGKG